jgi:PiT family inorganic phosphate transporter
VLTLLIVVIIAALVFDYINGFHDAANAIATTVTTGAMSFAAAVVVAGIFNFLGALSGEEVAKTIAKGLVENPGSVSQLVVLAALLGASFWNLLTWWFGIPSSSSHALIGGLAGAVVAHGGLAAFKWSALTMKVLVPLVLSPVVGFTVALLAMIGLTWLVRRRRPSAVYRQARLWQVASACTFSYSHGLNDAQKVMGIITLALVAYQAAPAAGVELPPWFLPNAAGNVPYWVKIACAAAIGLGTIAGGKRIIKTMGSKVTKIDPLQGFAAQCSGTLTLLVTGKYGLPVSTTHCISACVLGVGASRRINAVRWGVVANILIAWVLTLPASAAVAWISFKALELFFG